MNMAKADRMNHPVSFISDDTEINAKIFKINARRRVVFLLELICDRPSAVNVRFCAEEEMQQTNFMFRRKNKPTDVLSFPTHPGMQEETHGKFARYLLGDLLVCVPVCRKQARARRQSLAREIERMIVHGLVHLRGLDHERSDAAWRVMSACEKALLRELETQYGVADWIVDKGSKK